MPDPNVIQKKKQKKFFFKIKWKKVAGASDDFQLTRRQYEQMDCHLKSNALNWA